MSPGKHFEIIISGRQLAALVALVSLLVVLAFGLGVGVGLLEPRTERGAELATPSWRGTGGETTPRDSALFPPATAAPSVTAAAPTATPAVEPPPLLPADIAAATPPTLPGPTAAPAPPPSSTRPARPTPRPTATARPRPTTAPQAWIQVAALSSPGQAEGVRQRVVALGFAPEQVLVMPGTGGKYRVRLGPFPDQESAGRVVGRLHASGFPDAYALRE